MSGSIDITTSGKFRVRVVRRGKRLTLGSFTTREKAAEAIAKDAERARAESEGQRASEVARLEERRVKFTDRLGRMPKPMHPNRLGGVYFLQSSDTNSAPIKIGVAKSLARRVRELQTAHPYPLVLRAVLFGAGEVEETQLHAQFAYARLLGEWFTPSAEMARLIWSIRAKPPQFDEEERVVAAWRAKREKAEADEFTSFLRKRLDEERARQASLAATALEAEQTP